MIDLDGITYYGAGYRIYSPWENIGMSSLASLNFRSPVWVLSLGRPATKIKLEEGMQQHQPALEVSRWMSRVNMDRYASAIPVGDFRFDWQHSKLGDDIRLYAPQVFR